MLIISGWANDKRELESVSFNLAIEMLIISGLSAEVTFVPQDESFNLAIEMLIISGHVPAMPAPLVPPFQSRNRDAYHFRKEKGDEC